MNKLIQAVVFDMDGLMFDTETLGFRGWASSARELGITISDEDMKDTIGCTNGGIKDRLLRRYGDKFNFDAFYRGAEDFMLREVEKHGTPIKKGLRELLAHLREKGIKTALATSSHENIVDFFFAHANLGHDFDARACGDMVKRGKPDPEIFSLAATKLGIAPENCLALEDSHNGIKSAHGAGTKVVMVPDLLPPTPEITPLLYKCVNSLLDVIPLV